MMKQIAGVLLACLLTLTCVGAHAQSGTQDQAKNSVVRIYTEDDYLYTELYGDGSESAVQQGTWISTGSGVAVGNAGEDVTYIVTNRHVVSALTDASTAQKYFEMSERVLTGYENSDELSERIYVITGDLENRVSASIVAVSDRTDLAILKLTTPLTNRKPITIRTFDKIGSEIVYAIGFPAIADVMDVSGVAYSSTLGDMTVTQGTISRTLGDDKTREGEILQHDAEVSSGNSGGALVDTQGRLLGINTSIVSGDYEVNHSVSSNEVVAFLEEKNIPFTTQTGGGSTLYIIIGVAVVAAAVLAWLLINKMKPAAKQKSRPSDEKKAANVPEEASLRRHLIGESGVLAGKRYRLERKLVIGRDPSKCQIVFPKDTPKVSAVHCTLRFDGKTVTVVDENSTCGTFIDWKPIPKGKPIAIHRGQKLSLGSAAQTFSLHS